MVARHLGISPRSLHAAFEGTGTSVSARITAARLAHATRMLDGSHPFSMLDIALESGFNSLSTFYRTFAREFGVAPGERRRTTALPEATSA
ncbi:helix-turn-helix transcriptional regulator, partial [Nostoc sp. NIES-2111]